MNSYIATGIISNELKLRNGSYGAFTNGTLICNNGDKKIYLPFISYGEKAEELTRISVGSKICVNGYLDTYKDNDDNYRLSLVIKNFELFSGNVTSTLNTKEYW